MLRTRSPYVVRQASGDDLLAVVRLQHGHSGGGPPPDRPSPRQRAAWDRMLASDALSVYVAVAGPGADVVGNAGMTVVPNLGYDCRPSVFIEPVLVAAAHRRRGVGRLLLMRLLDDARAAGCHKVQLLSHKRHANDGAHAFYRSLGFEPEAEGFRLYLEAHPEASKST